MMFALAMILMYMMPRIQLTKPKISNWEHIELKCYYVAEEKQSTECKAAYKWEKTFENNLSNKGLISKHVRIFYTSIAKILIT